MIFDGSDFKLRLCPFEQNVFAIILTKGKKNVFKTTLSTFVK